MTSTTTERPIILVDLKKYRIRIHRSTLHTIGDPSYILLLVNPENQTLAILASERSDPRSHHITKASVISNKSIELYSMSLIKSLCDICNNWKDNQTYRLYGEIIQNGGVARFFMSEAVLVNNIET